MKKIIFVAIICVTLFNGCKKVYEDKAIGPPIYTTEKLNAVLNGKWILSNATQVDEKSLTKETIDITDFYTAELGSQLPNITFNTAAKTFTSDTTGVIVKYFGTGGTWAFDDDNYPKKIILTTGSGTVDLPIGSNLQVAGGYLQYQESADCSGTVTMTYKLKFVKQ